MGTKISDMVDAGTVTGAELIEVVQSSTSRKLALSAVRSWLRKNAVSALSTSSGAVGIDLSLGSYFTLALSADVTSISFSNTPGSGFGTTVMIRITQDTTARTVTWPGSFKWEGGTPGAVSTAAGAVDILALTTFDNGTTWQASLSKGRA